MTFKLTPRFQGEDLGSLQLPFNGTRQEVYQRGKDYARGLVSLFRQHGFSIRIERVDQPAQPYEIDEHGNTV